MFRDMLSGSRAIFIGLVFFVLVVGGSLLYSWHVYRTTDAELAKSDALLQQHKNKNGPHTAADIIDTSTVDVEQAETPLETDDLQVSDDTGVLPIDETSEVLDLSDAFLPDYFISAEAPAEDVPVSPYGFGPYPEVPADYPNDMRPSWTNTSRDHELMHRVLIRLWNQDDKFVSGGFMDNGLVYPLYPNTAYVEYRKINMPDGTVRRIIKSADGPLGTTPIVRNGFSVLPDGVKGINKKDAGINPYDFLDLK